MGLWTSPRPPDLYDAEMRGMIPAARRSDKGAQSGYGWDRALSLTARTRPLSVRTRVFIHNLIKISALAS